MSRKRTRQTSLVYSVSVRPKIYDLNKQQPKFSLHLNKKDPMQLFDQQLTFRVPAGCFFAWSSNLLHGHLPNMWDLMELGARGYRVSLLYPSTQKISFFTSSCITKLGATLSGLSCFDSSEMVALGSHLDRAFFGVRTVKFAQAHAFARTHTY